MNTSYIIASVLTVGGLFILFLTSIVAYLFISENVISRYCLPIQYKTDGLLGRGLHRFVYPEGRAVLYEPHPSIRKYVRRYLLFTVDGYKYLRLRLGGRVNSLFASIVMYDNRDKVIDRITVSTVTGGAKYSSPILLSEKTSYIAFVLESVNGIPQKTPVYMQTRALDLLIYFVASAALTFAEFSATVSILSSILLRTAGTLPFDISYSFFILPSMLVGIVNLGIVMASRAGKGIKVVLK